MIIYSFYNQKRNKLLSKIQLTIKNKKENFIRDKWRIITLETDSQKATRTVPTVRRHSRIHF